MAECGRVRVWDGFDQLRIARATTINSVWRVVEHGQHTHAGAALRRVVPVQHLLQHVRASPASFDLNFGPPALPVHVLFSSIWILHPAR